VCNDLVSVRPTVVALTPGAIDAAARMAPKDDLQPRHLAGVEDEPGWLDGYGPITADTARALAADETGPGCRRDHCLKHQARCRSDAT